MPGVFVPFALAAGFSLLSTATMASGPEIREFRDWRAGCDNVGHCTALSLPDDEDNAIAYLRLDRAAGADAPVRLVLRVLGDWKTVSVPLRLTLDGAAFPATAEAAQVGTDSGTISLTFQPAEASAFVAAARKATQLSISTPDMTAHVSLSGSVAAMLWIDEQQGRLDTPSALIRKGSGSHVPAALALPVITAKVPDGVLADDAGKALAAAVRQEMLRRDSDLCEDEETLAALDEAWLLDGTRRLVGLACSRGAYNVTTGFWTVEGDDAATAQPRPLPLRRRGDDGEHAGQRAIRPENRTARFLLPWARHRRLRGHWRLCLDPGRLCSNPFQHDGRVPGHCPGRLDCALSQHGKVGAPTGRALIRPCHRR